MTLFRSICSYGGSFFSVVSLELSSAFGLITSSIFLTTSRRTCFLVTTAAIRLASVEQTVTRRN